MAVWLFSYFSAQNKAPPVGSFPFKGNGFQPDICLIESTSEWWLIKNTTAKILFHF